MYILYRQFITADNCPYVNIAVTLRKREPRPRRFPRPLVLATPSTLATPPRAEMIYENYNEFQAVLHVDGRLRWEPGGIFKTMCHIDITYYPFDEQKCDLTFGAWAYYTNKMNMTTNKVSASVSA